MSRVIIIGTHGHGHVNPTLPVVSQLVQNGHEVIYYNDEEFHANIAGAGAEFRPYPSDVDTSPDRLARAVNGHMMDITLHLFEVSMTLTQYMLDEIQRENPTALIFDSVALWGLQAARITGIPAVSSITVFVTKGIDVPLKFADYLYFLCGAIVRLPRFINQRRTLVKRYGRDSLPAKGIFPGTGSMNIVFTSRDLQPATTFIDDSYHFVGPSLAGRPDDTPLELPARKPLVYISLGTIHTFHRGFLQKCFDAFSDYDDCFVVSAGRTADTVNPPPNFVVKSSVRQLAMLRRADLFITHAGMNGVQEGLYYGVPMVFIPQQMEQLINARIAEAKGVGIIIGDMPPYGEKFTVEELRDVVAKVLANPKYRSAAQRLSRSLRAAGGTERAVQLIELFLRDSTAAPVDARFLHCVRSLRLPVIEAIPG